MPTDAEKFWAKVDKSDGCWVFGGPKWPSGYGSVTYVRDGKLRHAHAHRYAYELTYGPIPDGLFACHHCDNRPCVRPDHLFLGTIGDNNRDCTRKGRRPCGESVHNAKLTEVALGDIRRRLAAGELQGALAAEHGVTNSSLYRALTGRTWRRVTGSPKRSSGPRRGSAVRLAKLTEVSVSEIRDLWLGGASTKDLAAQYGVCNSSVYKIVRGLTWRHVTPAD